MGVTILSYLCWVIKTQICVKLKILQEILCPNMENPDWVSASTLQKIRESVPAVRAEDRVGKAIAILVILQATIGYNYIILVVCAYHQAERALVCRLYSINFIQIVYLYLLA